MKISFKLDGINEALKNLEKLDDAVASKIVRATVRAGGRVILKQAKDLAPYDTSRKSGVHLRDALVLRKISRTNDIFRVGSVSRKAPHAHLVEFGTVKWAGKPFFRKAFLEKRQEAVAKMLSTFIKLTTKEAKKLENNG